MSQRETASSTAPADLDRVIARLLTVGALVSVGLLAVGAVLMLASRIQPLAGFPRFDPSLIPADVAQGRPVGYIWLGLILAVLTPGARVLASLFGYIRSGERSMAVVAGLILAVLVVSVAFGLAEA
jgi:uncharacterized membrane protein